MDASRIVIVLDERDRVVVVDKDVVYSPRSIAGRRYVVTAEPPKPGRR